MADFNVRTTAPHARAWRSHMRTLPQITSELFNVLKNHKRQAQFVEFLQARYCVENYLVWARTTELLDVIRDTALPLERERNELMFAIYDTFLREQAAQAVSISSHSLRAALEEMVSALRFIPNSVFDVRLVLELQKEAELLLVADVKTFCMQNPFIEAEPEVATLEDVVNGGAALVALRLRGSHSRSQ